MKVVRRVAKVLLCLVLAIVVAVGVYVGYLMATYSRIPDAEPVEIQGNAAGGALRTNTAYTASTYNIGFGAYTPEFSFFADEGIMADGTRTVGEHGVATSKESVVASTDGVVATISGLNPDFALFQEVDVDSTRSYGVNQKAALEEAFANKSSAYAVNFHSSFLAYPVPEMHGLVNGGILTLADAHASSATRCSYPVSDEFPDKFFDLDRCFLVERFPVENGKELVLINSHMSAYDEGGMIRAQQLEMLIGLLASEAAAGNYVIAGGDWNHVLCGSENYYESKQRMPDWLAVFDESMLPESFSVVRAENIEDVATCRCADIPYTPGTTYTATIDGFFVSSNVKATARNVDTGFAYSDHTPVLLTFELV